VHIHLNGREHEASEGSTVAALLEAIRLPPGRVAVEVNGQVIRRADYARQRLSENDRIEVVHFVGGG
jgi:thiamine biosynthesis protein ThiS